MYTQDKDHHNKYNHNKYNYNQDNRMQYNLGFVIVAIIRNHQELKCYPLLEFFCIRSWDPPPSSIFKYKKRSIWHSFTLSNQLHTVRTVTHPKGQGRNINLNSFKL